MKKSTKTDKIRKLLKQGVAVAKIAKLAKVSPNYVYQLRHKAKAEKYPELTKVKKGRPRKGAKMRMQSSINAEFAAVRGVNEMLAKMPDDIAHPHHYTVGGIESWDYIEAKGLDYNLGTAIAYISRAKYKGQYLKDLKKAAAHLNRAIQMEESVALA